MSAWNSIDIDGESIPASQVHLCHMDVPCPHCNGSGSIAVEFGSSQRYRCPDCGGKQFDDDDDDDNES